MTYWLSNYQTNERMIWILLNHYTITYDANKVAFLIIHQLKVLYGYLDARL